MLSLVAFSPTAPVPGCLLSTSGVRPLPVTSVHPSLVPPLPRGCAKPARISTAPCSNDAHCSPNVNHQFRPFSPLHASPISVSCFPHMTKTISMSSNVIIFLVNLHPLLWGSSPITHSMWLNVAQPQVAPYFIVHRSSLIVPFNVGERGGARARMPSHLHSSFVAVLA
jgi:hypothetical protein